MTFARGRTNCQEERDIVFQGFREQIQILENSQKEQEAAFKAQLYDIITDFSISEDEKVSLKSSWINELGILEERHIRIRRSVFIGLYSLWEVSLMDIANTYFPAKTISNRATSHKSEKLGTGDYLKTIYGDTIPQSVKMINTNIREFRNYIVHGSLNKNRESLINSVIKEFPEFRIKSSCKSFFISEYNGLSAILEHFAFELDNAENRIKEIINQNTK